MVKVFISSFSNCAYLLAGRKAEEEEQRRRRLEVEKRRKDEEMKRALGMFSFPAFLAHIIIRARLVLMGEKF